MKTFTVYRVEAEPYYTRYKPVIRAGKPITRKRKADAEQWLIDNPPKSTAKPQPTYEVRRTIKK